MNDLASVRSVAAHTVPDARGQPADAATGARSALGVVAARARADPSPDASQTDRTETSLPAACLADEPVVRSRVALKARAPVHVAGFSVSSVARPIRDEVAYGKSRARTNRAVERVLETSE